MLRRMEPSDRPTLVILGVKPTPRHASIRRAMNEWRLAGRWRWHWLSGTRRELAEVWAAYGITVAPARTTSGTASLST